MRYATVPAFASWSQGIFLEGRVGHRALPESEENTFKKEQELVHGSGGLRCPEQHIACHDLTGSGTDGPVYENDWCFARSTWTGTAAAET